MLAQTIGGPGFANGVRSAFERDFTLSALRVVIVLWALFVIALAFLIDDKWLLAGILAYEVLP